MFEEAKHKMTYYKIDISSLGEDPDVDAIHKYIKEQIMNGCDEYGHPYGDHPTKLYLLNCAYWATEYDKNSLTAYSPIGIYPAYSSVGYWPIYDINLTFAEETDIVFTSYKGGHDDSRYTDDLPFGNLGGSCTSSLYFKGKIWTRGF